LLETALAAQQLGLKDALNLDGGSSTTVVVAGRTVMNGRGSAPRVHNGLGFIPL
jgi:exopolysaccharide biosynthesis protein